MSDLWKEHPTEPAREVKPLVSTHDNQRVTVRFDDVAGARAVVISMSQLEASLLIEDLKTARDRVAAHATR